MGGSLLDSQNFGNDFVAIDDVLLLLLFLLLLLLLIRCPVAAGRLDCYIPGAGLLRKVVLPLVMTVTKPIVKNSKSSYRVVLLAFKGNFEGCPSPISSSRATDG
jgi:hypothetical protein